MKTVTTPTTMDGSKRKPPGPAGLPLLGSFLEARRDPLRFAMRIIRDHGDIVRFRVGYYSGYLLNHPDYFQHVLNTNHRNYNKENYNYRKLKPVLGEGLITSGGELWRRHRRMIQPVFHYKRIEGFASITIRAAEEVLEEWERSARGGHPIDIAGDIMELTLRIIIESLFGNFNNSYGDVVADAFTTLNRDIADRFKSLFVAPLWVPTRRNREFKRARARLDRLVYKIIARRNRSQDEQSDLLDALLSAREEKAGTDQAWSDRQVRDEVMTLMLAGHETTANLLVWTCYLLSQHPETENRLRLELKEQLGDRDPLYRDLPDLKYTRSVLRESLRLYPPVWVISRKAIEDDMIGGYAIPAESTVTLCSYTLHRHPGFWKNPEKFRPGRFLLNGNDRRHEYAYVPFGGGPRSCIGNHFAMMEAMLILAMVYRRFHLKPLKDDPVEPEPLVTLRPRNGMHMMPETISL